MYFLCSMYFCVVLCIVCFVSFSVLFACMCVLYYCHRVATQLQLNISYHISYIVSYHISYHITSHHITSHHITSYHITHISYIIYHICFASREPTSGGITSIYKRFCLSLSYVLKSPADGFLEPKHAGEYIL
jgi:hypothetical protein